MEYDQAALDLLKYCNKDDFKTWDQSLAPMNDAQAQEIKTFVDDQIVKGETEDYKKQDLFMIGLQKTYGMQDQMIQISDLLRMMCLRRKWLCAEVIQICIKRCLMR